MPKNTPQVDAENSLIWAVCVFTVQDSCAPTIDCEFACTHLSLCNFRSYKYTFQITRVMYACWRESETRLFYSVLYPCNYSSSRFQSRHGPLLCILYICQTTPACMVFVLGMRPSDMSAACFTTLCISRAHAVPCCTQELKEKHSNASTATLPTFMSFCNTPSDWQVCVAQEHARDSKVYSDHTSPS